MVEQLSVERVGADPVASREMEFVERKGLGHPDTLCDGIAEAVSRALSAYYREAFGRVCHHNTDKVHLGAGRSAPAFGGGVVLEPLYVLVGGRATRRVDGEMVPVSDIAVDAARTYLTETVPALGPGDVEVETRIGQSSTDLRALFERGAAPLANDTSFGVGHAPLSPTERLCRTLEPHIHRELDAVGPDVKLMAVRRGDALQLTVAAAVVDRAVADLADYLAVREAVADLAREHAAETVPDLDVDVRVNTADDPDAGSVYLTTTGLSAEMGDDGAVGRGNRVNGLITPHRSMSLEAAAGKNPVNHVGKLYNVGAGRVAERLAGAGAEFASVQLLSRIGQPVTDPWAVDVTVAGVDREAVEAAVAAELEALPDLTDAFVRGTVDVF